MGARHLRVSTVDRCADKFFSLCSKWMYGFSDRECDSPGSQTALAWEIVYYLFLAQSLHIQWINSIIEHSFVLRSLNRHH
jgi:hypothetical protein